MPGGPPVQTMLQIISAENWYVHFNDAAVDAEHNDHLVVCFGLSAVDSITIVPFITDLAQQYIVEVSTVSANYSLYNPYNTCGACVRPPVPPPGDIVPAGPDPLPGPGGGV